MCKRLLVVDNALRAFFNGLGRQIGLHPGYFIIVPALLTALAASGFQRITYEADPEYLFSPLDGRAKVERQVLESHFPLNFTDFDPSRISRPGKFGQLIIEARDNGTLFRERVFNQILFMDELVRNVTYYNEEDERNYTYVDLCAMTEGYCWDNRILGIGRYMREVEQGSINLTYPMWFDIDTFERYMFPFFMGGLEVDDEDILVSAKAILLSYFLDTTTPEDAAKGKKWESAFLQVVGQNSHKLPDIKVYHLSSLTLEEELENNTNSVIPFFSFNVGLMIGFCILTCMMTDWVKSKPLLGLFGIISAIMGTLTAFGFCIYLGVPFIGINMAAPFLMLGIGIDDTFVMLGAWRRTSIHSKVPDRMSETFQDAAVSITITSLTDMLSFWIGIITPFPCVKIFCVYTGTCVTFTYLWHVTFFGACMAIAGNAERDNRHALTCMRVISKSQSKGKGFFYNVFCAGGVNEKDPFNPKDNRENTFMVFFRDVFASVVNRVPIKVIVLIGFSAYVALSGWSISNIEEGLSRKHLARYDSYSVEFYHKEESLFKDYPFRVSVVFNGHLDYSNKTIQDDVDRIIKTLENHPNIEALYTESWLRDFLDYVKRNEPFQPIDISTDEKFVEALNTTYLSSGPMYARDVDISDGKIVGARFVIQAKNLYNSNHEKKFVTEIRGIVDSFDYDVTVFHPYFIFFDQFIAVLPTTIQCVCVAAGVMMVVSLILIPNPLCSLWVAFCIISIELGVLGIMPVWGVRLDAISMINLIMCIGFSVDFSAHISYHFMAHKKLSIDERVRDSLYALGLPISQGAISTILGVIGLALAPSYIFLTFFKMVFLVIVLGALHGLILLPVLLSLSGNETCSRSPSASSEDMEIPKTFNSVVKDKKPSCDHGRYFGQHLQIENQIKIPRPSTTLSRDSGSEKSSSTTRKESRCRSGHGEHHQNSRNRDSRSGSRSSYGEQPKNSSRGSSASKNHCCDEEHKTKVESKNAYKLHELYTNRGYESEMDNISRGSSGSNSNSVDVEIKKPKNGKVKGNRQV